MSTASGGVSRPGADRESRRRRVGYVVTVLGVLGFSSKAIFAKLAYPYGIDPISLMTLRSLVAVPALWLLLALLREPVAPLDGNGWLRMFWAGLSGYYLAAFLDFYGLQTVTAILERIVIFLYPCFVVLLGALLERRRLGAATWWSLTLAYGGVVTILLAGGWDQISGDVRGLASILVAAAVFASYYLIAGDLARRLTAVRFSAYLMSIAGAATLIHFLVVRSPAALIEQPLPVYLYAVGLGLFSTVMPIVLIAEGLRRIETGSSAAINFFGPVFTVALAYAVLGEALRPWQWLGFGMVLLGVFALDRSIRLARNAVAAAK